MQTPCEVMFLASSLLMYLAGLQKEQGKREVAVRHVKADEEGVRSTPGTQWWE
jgi:hypothetical protein